MRVDEFDFDLPDSAIAVRPASPRESARLLIIEPGRPLQDRIIADLPDCLRPGDMLVFNDTRVIPAQLFGRRGDAHIEITLHKRTGPGQWQAFARPARRLHEGDSIEFAGGFRATVTAPRQGGEVSLDFGVDDAALLGMLHLHGTMPLPPYIRKSRPADTRDQSDYQTVFASHDGAVAAPTAGLHFTDPLLQSLGREGIAQARLTLHVGAGTFLPVTADDTDDHKMHSEIGEITPETANAINAVRRGGGRIVAVGTTVLRLLESAAGDDGEIRPFSGETDIFITPGYRFKAVDLLLTNFHLPRSTLFMLVSAFSGLETMRGAYAHAIEAGYRFYSYGDACLLHRAA
jgi:S-adenosylmethionine:tRNA ribosyltransferase-isomerase